jgi:hypothetical protein
VELRDILIEWLVADHDVIAPLDQLPSLFWKLEENSIVHIEYEST